MEDPDPPLDTLEGFGVSKPGCLRGQITSGGVSGSYIPPSSVGGSHDSQLPKRPGIYWVRGMLPLTVNEE